MPSLDEHSHCLRVALRNRDSHTELHCARVERLCMSLGRGCGLTLSELDVLRVAARLHDLGKIGIPDVVLLKPGKLDEAEWRLMKTHPILGQQMCEALPHEDAPLIGRFVRHHHEAFAGGGYPDGLAGEAIPIESRIISVVDSYDAMTMGRPYRRSQSVAEVLAVMTDECGEKHDPAVFRQFRRIIADETPEFP